ncbi:MAG: DUF1848 domain-containing protein [Sedimentisphaerales bacterium]|nr:DUF1848 domain-containing protein [Sedimentisphaerales bacterium]
MKRIISVSRRTDIPAFYGGWFMNRLREGFAGVVNPFGGQKYIVSLKPEDVWCFVFWSKNFTPFLENLKVIEGLGYKFYFNYTITALPDIFESNVDRESATDTLKLLSRMYSPGYINWRFDPIIISDICDGDFFIKAFAKLAGDFAGLVERCYFSFVTEYGKVIRNFKELERVSGVKILNVSEKYKIELANELARIAEGYGIRMYSCCGDYLINERIGKGHCIDGEVIKTLFFPESFEYKQKPTRSECGCAESSDIGTYDTCPHGCVYCYANTNKRHAGKFFESYKSSIGENIASDSAFLGYSKSQSDKWLGEMQI